MTEKLVYAVERDCIDPYFEAHLVAIFSTEEKAKEFISTQHDKRDLNISEWELDVVETK
jgi:hypothetical protein